MTSKAGGTLMYCPHCGVICAQRAVTVKRSYWEHLSSLWETKSRYEIPGRMDHFERCRVCSNCSRRWTSYEIPEGDLIALFQKYDEVKGHIDELLAERKQALASVRSMSATLMKLDEKTNRTFWERPS